MAKMKVYEIAKEVNKRSREVISFLNDQGVDIKSHMSNIDDHAINLIRKEFATPQKNKPSSKVNETQVKQANTSSQSITKENLDRNQKRVHDTKGKEDRTSQNRNQQSRGNTQGNRGNYQNKRSNTGQRNYQGSQGTQRTQGSQGQDQGNRPQRYQSQSNRPQGSQTQGNRPQRPQGQSNMNRSENQRTDQKGRSSNYQGQNNRRPYNNQQNQNSNTRSQQNTRNNTDNKNFGNRNATSGKNNMHKKDFITDKLENMDNNRNVPKGKKNNNSSLAASRNEVVNRRNNRDKTKNNRNFQKDTKEVESKVIKKGQFIKPKPVEVKKEEVKTITIPESLTIKELADKMKITPSTIVKKLFLEGKIVTLNDEITYEEAEEIAIEYDILVEEEIVIDEIEELLKEEEDDPSTLVKRPPVVCVMGHVDHGKTSLLDAIRFTQVTSQEAGGITQHIGAYIVEANGEKIAFLDTPGHEAFTSMRMRGAQSTDIAILVVAADDGVMPQTVEAINHAKAAGVEIIVAINKVDKPSANIERVKQELVEHELIAEDWGGDTVFVPVSALTKEGIDTLLEMVILTAEMQELKANPDRNARGLVVEAELDKGRGPVATILVQKGTLRVGDAIAVGTAYGKVRAMINDKGKRVEVAPPSTPVEILGLNEVPEAGETFLVTDSEKEARGIAGTYLAQSRERLIANTKSKLSLDGLFSQIQAGNIKELNIIVKADVQGSVEAVKQSLEKLSNEEVAVRIIHGGVGAVTESDILLASASNAVIIGFNVRPDNTAKEIAVTEKVDIRLYRVIYNAIEDVEAAMKGLLDPTYAEKVLGRVEIRQIFKASGVGNIAGAYVLDGKITRASQVRIIRDGIVVYDGKLTSLKRFQDDTREVAAGFECGLVFERFNDIKVGDTVEAYIMEEIPR